MRSLSDKVTALSIAVVALVEVFKKTKLPSSSNLKADGLVEYCACDER